LKKRTLIILNLFFTGGGDGSDIQTENRTSRSYGSCWYAQVPARGIYLLIICSKSHLNDWYWTEF